MRVSNEAAIHLYRDVLKYEEVGVEAKYYADGEDAYNMRMTFREGPRADADVDAPCVRLVPTTSLISFCRNSCDLDDSAAAASRKCSGTDGPSKLPRRSRVAGGLSGEALPVLLPPPPGGCSVCVAPSAERSDPLLLVLRERFIITSRSDNGSGVEMREE